MADLRFRARGAEAQEVAGVVAELAEETLQSSGRLRLRVVGSSMLPSIWPDDVLVISRRDLSRIRPDEMALFTLHGRLVTHRVKKTGDRSQSGTDAENAGPGRQGSPYRMAL